MVTATLVLVEATGVRGPFSGLEDAQLAALSAAGEARALGALYDRHGAACYRMALRVTANRALAEEVVQETFLALWRSERYSARLGSLRSWLLALSHHKAVDAVRRETARDRREVTYEGRERAAAQTDDEPEPTLLGTLRDGAVRDALLELSRPQRQALVLAYYEGRSQRQIAEITGVPLGTVKTRMLAGMRRMRARLSAADDAPREGSR